MICWRSSAMPFCWGMALLLFAGCATLSGGLPLSPEEEASVRAQAIEVLRMPEDGCGNCLDVQARVVLQSFWQSGTVDGYLVARSPGWFKFVGLTPLGQPLLLLATDGTRFRYIAVPEAKVYEGATQAAAFRKHAPAGFDPRRSFFWLTGRLAPDAGLGEVSRDAGGGGYWLEVLGEDGSGRRLVLFDPMAQVISRALLFDDNDKLLLEVLYAAYRPAASSSGAACMMPGTVDVISKHRGGWQMTMVLSDWILGTACETTDFTVAAPPSFETVRVE